MTDGVVATDPQTAAYLVDLIVGEARWQTSEPNVIVTAVLRDLADRLLDGSTTARRDRIAAMTDSDFWDLLSGDPQTADTARQLRSDSTAWRLLPGSEVETRPGDLYFRRLPAVSGSAVGQRRHGDGRPRSVR